MNIEEKSFSYKFRAMASKCEMVFNARDREDADNIYKETLNEIRRIEKKYSRYLTESVVSKINANAGIDWIDCDKETTALFDYADKLFETSDQLFDITSGVLRRAWNFKAPKIPSNQMIDGLLSLIDYKLVLKKENKIKLAKPGMEIDFGGFGKEYAVDRASHILLKNKCTSGFINLGGDIFVLGPKLSGESWVMGIRDPRNKDKIVAHIPIDHGALATSGDYEKYFELDGKVYCHIISPKTGFPVNAWQSATVLAPLTVTAGSYSTIIMLKEFEGLSWIKNSEASFLVIDQKSKIYKN